MQITDAERLARLLIYLERDPHNLRLLNDVAETAINCDDAATAANALVKHEEIAPLPPKLLNLQAILALQQQRFADAETLLADLHRQSPEDPSINFNLAWTLAKMDRQQEAADLITDVVASKLPQAAVLKIRMLHSLGHFEDALAQGRGFAEVHPDDSELMGALSVLALDNDEPALAQEYGARSTDRHEGMTTLGVLALGAGHTDQALAQFDQALAQNDNSPRAWVGKGLALLAAGSHLEAAQCLDLGAELFDTHLGSWVASAWAYFVCQDYIESRARFERALALDAAFAETQGGLAVLDIVEGHVESAARRTEIALRLDRHCFAGALAQSMLLEASGDRNAALRVRNLVLGQSLGKSGETVIAAIARMTGRQ